MSVKLRAKLLNRQDTVHRKTDKYKTIYPLYFKGVDNIVNLNIITIITDTIPVSFHNIINLKLKM